MSNLEAIGIIVGVLSGMAGLFLGILNYLHQRDTTHPRIMVRPHVWFLGDMNTGKTIAENAGVIEICNVGQVPVIGSMIGFRPAWPWQKGSCLCPKPEAINGVKWTDELKPGHVALLRFNLEGLPDARKLGRAFATTIIGDTFKASRREMRRFAKSRKAASSSAKVKSGDAALNSASE